MITYCPPHQHLVDIRSEEGSNGCQNINKFYNKNWFLMNLCCKQFMLKARCWAAVTFLHSLLYYNASTSGAHETTLLICMIHIRLYFCRIRLTLLLLPVASQWWQSCRPMLLSFRNWRNLLVRYLQWPTCLWCASEQSLSAVGCTVFERRTALSPDNVDNILFLPKIGLMIQVQITRPKILSLFAYIRQWRFCIWLLNLV